MHDDSTETMVDSIISRMPTLEHYRIELIIYLGLGYYVDVRHPEQELVERLQEWSDELLEHVVGIYDSLEEFVDEYLDALEIPNTLRNCIDKIKAWKDHYSGEYYVYKVSTGYAIVTYAH